MTSACIGYWRLIAIRGIACPPVRCELIEGAEGLDGGGDSGEGLDAQTWENETRRISIGTEDSEFLQARARAGDHLPRSWAEHLDWGATPYPVTLLPFGLELCLPELPANELCEVHHAAAWQLPGNGADVSTWYAVDLIRNAMPSA